MTAGSETERDGTGWGVLDGLPGHPMMWVLILSELVVFGLLLGAFGIARIVHRADFAAGQAQLESLLAFVNTLVLIASGWLAARAVASARAGARRAAQRRLAGAMLLGGAFIAVKGHEYAGEFANGLDPETSPFATLYLLLTGFHLLHVGLGIVILAVVARHAGPDDVETGTAFWHMVDLVWLMMFPVIYLVR